MYHVLLLKLYLLNAKNLLKINCHFFHYEILHYFQFCCYQDVKMLMKNSTRQDLFHVKVIYFSDM